MKTSTVLGITIPLIIMILISLVGILNVGVTIDQSSPQSIKKSDLFLNKSYENNGPTIMTIEVQNSFIFKRTESVNFIICTKGIGNYYSQQLSYKVFVDGANPGDIYSPSNNQVEVNSGETKLIEIKPTFYNYYGNDYYNNTTELLIFKGDRNSLIRKNCPQLIIEDSNQAIKINVI